MRADKPTALKLRLGGKSYNEIQRTLGVPKSTLSGWFSNLVLSSNAQTRLKKRVHEGSLRGLLKRNKEQTRLAILRARQNRTKGIREIEKLGQYELLLIGAALYWAEGYKRVIVTNGRERIYHPVALTNSDPNLVAIFLRFIREVCEVPDEHIRADVRIYEHMNTENVIKFWQKITHLPERNFGKVYYGVSKSSQNKRPFTRLPYGTILIRVSRTNLFHRIMGWIEGLANQAAMV